MADEPGDGASVPEPVRAWLADVAAAEGVSERELLGRLLSSDGGGVLEEPDAPTDLEGRLADLERAVADLDAELERKIEDVRDRVVQLKLEGETKAEADHDHPRVEARVDRLDATVGDLEGAVDRLSQQLGTVEERADQGFENFEDVLEYLVETTDDLHERASRLAEATLDQRERVERLAGAEARRAAAEELQETAADHGVKTADCESCGEAVTVGLLAAPTCPHCGVQFTDLEPRRGFFRSSVLHAGQRPALEGEVAGSSPELQSLVDDGERPTPPVGGADGSAPTGPDGTDAEAGRAPPATDDGAAGGEEADSELTAVTGIGPAYAERLRGAGVETVGELALADPDRLAADADIDPGRVDRMVRRARERVGSG